MASKVKSRELEAFHVAFQPGVVSDDTPFKLGQAGWVSADGVRPFRQGMETVRGYETYTTETFSGKCRGLFAWRDNDKLVNVAVGTHTGLYVEVGGGFYDISPFDDGLITEDSAVLWAEDDEPLITESLDGAEDGFGGAGYGTGAYGVGAYGQISSVDFTPMTWTFGQYGEWLIANPRGRGICRWQNDITETAKPLPNAPAVVDSILVTDRQIIAYGCSEELSGDYNPRCIRWCDFEDVTDWTTATNNNAGEYVIDDAGGIIRAMQVGSLIYVFTNDGVYVQQYLGQPGQTYFIDLVEKGCGLAGPNAVTVISQTVFWMSPDRKLWMMPYGGTPVRLVSPNAREVADNLAASQEAKVYATTRKEFNEVRFYYPDDRDGDGLECSRYISYNITEGKWSQGNYARTAEIDQGTTLLPVSAGVSGGLYFEERGFSANGAALSRSAKSGFFYVAEGGRVIMLRRLWPDFDDRQGIITLKLYSRMEPGGDETEHGPYTVRPTDTVIDLGNVCGAMFALEWSCATAPAFWRLGKITMNGVIRGKGLR